MSTNPCLSDEALAALALERAVTMSMRRLGAAVIRHQILQALGGEGRVLAIDRDR